MGEAAEDDISCALKHFGFEAGAALGVEAAVLGEVGLVMLYLLGQRVYARAFGGYGLDDGRDPMALGSGEEAHGGLDLADEAVGAFAVGFVDDEHVSYL